VRRLALLALFFTTAAAPDIRYFHSLRPLQNIPQPPTQACLVVDTDLFAHSAPGLADVRLYRDRTETPYLIQESAPAVTATEQDIAPLNLGDRGGQTVFDAAMPPGSYSDLQLKIAGQNFIATVAVTGSQAQTGPQTKVGSYTIFDLTHQRLGRSTVLHLPTSDFRYLHFRIAGPIHPDAIGAVQIARRSAYHPTYVNVAESTQAVQKGQTTVIEFTVPARVPVDQIDFVPGPAPANFSRDVTVVATAIQPAPATDSGEPPASAESVGNLLRVHTVQEEHHIDQERLTLAASGAVFDTPSKWTITIDNGDDAPLVPARVRLQMLERDLCFQASPGAYALYYGDAALSAPRYDLGNFFVVHVKDAAQMIAAPEQQNPEYQPRPDDRPFTEKHPALLWIALALVVALLGVVALRSAKPASQPEA
jgi:hypothetical protein